MVGISKKIVKRVWSQLYMEYSTGKFQMGRKCNGIKPLRPMDTEMEYTTTGKVLLLNI